MAIGDIVSNIYTADTTFQPAATVQIYISAYLANGQWTLDGVGDIDTVGNAFSFGVNTATDTQRLTQFVNTPKIFIDNSSYLTFDLIGASGYGGFTGIQTQ